MSREIVVLGAFAGALVAALLSSLAESGWPPIELALWTTVANGAGFARAAACATGLLGLLCSIMIYAVTGRPLWRLDRTALRFGGSVVLLGAAISSAAWTVVQGSSVGGEGPGDRLPLLLLPLLVGLLVTVKLWLERRVLIQGEAGHDDAALARTRSLYEEALRPAVRTRSILAVIFGVGLPLGQAVLVAGGSVGPAAMAAAVLCLLGCLAAECLERSLFFRGEAMRGMPGAH
jgi:DMSO reductase anchor subunit